MKPALKALQYSFLFLLGCFIASPLSEIHAQKSRDKRKTEADSNYTVKLRDGIEIRGTYAIPAKNMPLLILVQAPIASERRHVWPSTNRGMFRTLADNLNELGYGVFWFDNRGLGFSEGKSDSTTLYTQAEDVKDIVAHFKKRIPKTRIGLIGHSEGGCVSEVVASSDSPGTRIDLLILLSTPYMAGYKSFQYQIQNMISDQPDPIKNARVEMDSRILRFYPRLFEVLEMSDNTDTLRRLLRNEIRLDLQKFPTSNKESEKQIELSLYENWTSPHQIALRKYKPEQYLSRIKCPILALCGDKDRLLECDPHFQTLETLLRKSEHTDFTTQRIPQINHAYQTIKDGSEYERVYKREGFSQLAFKTIADWLMARR